MYEKLVAENKELREALRTLLDVHTKVRPGIAPQEQVQAIRRAEEALAKAPVAGPGAVHLTWLDPDGEPVARARVDDGAPGRGNR